MTPSSSPADTSTPIAVESPSLILQLKPEEQAAVDAVQAYLDKWTYIGQNLPDVDYNSIREVSDGSAANNALQEWALWIQHGWHLVGTPEFELTYVSSGATDDLGTRYHVHGCYSSENAYLVDSTGAPLEKGSVRGTALYLVLTTPDNGSGVLEETDEGQPC